LDRAEGFVDTAREGRDSHAVTVSQGNVADGGGEAEGREQLWGSAPAHATTVVNNNMDSDILGRLSELDEQVVAAGVGVPIYIAQIVARRIGAVVHHVRPWRASPRAMRAHNAAAQGTVGLQGQPLQTPQEGLIEEGGRLDSLAA
jgi:hypothetical protein